MAKKGLLKYAEDGGIADDAGKDKGDKPEAKPESASEMLGLELFEKAFSPPYGSDVGDLERKRRQLKAFKELLAYCHKGG